MQRATAYAIFDGGGVKGAALAGALSAAEKHYEFVGYGGTSAGAIIALLGCVGYTGAELETVVTEDMCFGDLLDDKGVMLGDLRQFVANVMDAQAAGGVRGAWRTWRAWKKLHAVRSHLKEHFGLYEGKPLQAKLHQLIKRKKPELKHCVPIRFGDLEQAKCAPSRVVASDVTSHRPAVFSAETHRELPVMEAIRASTCYPLVFKPCRMGNRLLADGGLSSNLPVFLFEDEQRRCGAQVVAFDLIAPAPEQFGEHSVRSYALDIMATAMDASESIIQDGVRGIIRIPIHLDKPIAATEFGLTKEAQKDLYNTGRRRGLEFFEKQMPQVQEASDDIVRQLQARYGRPQVFQRALESIALDFAIHCLAEGKIRAHVMLPTGRGTRVVVYHAHMAGDGDEKLELPLTAGCSGRAWERRAPVIADLKLASDRYNDQWGMTQEQQARVPKDLTLMLSAPIFAPTTRQEEVADPHKRRVIGTISIDTEGNTPDTGWVEKREGQLVPTAETVARLTGWADVCGQMLAER